jgi:hypothetical protein
MTCYGCGKLVLKCGTSGCGDCGHHCLEPGKICWCVIPLGDRRLFKNSPRSWALLGFVLMWGAIIWGCLGREYPAI